MIQTLTITFHPPNTQWPGVTVLTGGLDEDRQEVRGERADVEENAGRLGGAEAEPDLLVGEVRRRALLLL